MTSTYFASEIKALAAAGVPLIADTTQLTNVLLYRSSDVRETCFKNIFKVPPGKIIRISHDQKILIMDGPEYSFSTEHEELETLLLNTVESHLMSDVPTGVFLSGGVDSGLIAAMASKIASEKIKTFTVGYNSPLDERSVARSISRHINSDHSEINVSFHEMSSHFNRIVWHMDEPILDPSFFPSYFLAQGTSPTVKVVLSGEGADEVFAGYDKHLELLADIEKNDYKREEIAKAYLSKRMPFDFNEAAYMGFEITSSISTLVNELERSIPTKALRSALNIDQQIMLPSLQLMRVDKATMAHGLEARVPFLDRAVIGAARDMSDDNLLSKGESKISLRAVARKYLPHNVTDVPKRVFYVPLDEWINGVVRRNFEEIIRESKILPELIDKTRLHENLSKLNSYQIWSLRVLESWHENSIRGSGLKPSL